MTLRLSGEEMLTQGGENRDQDLRHSKSFLLFSLFARDAVKKLI